MHLWIGLINVVTYMYATICYDQGRSQNVPVAPPPFPTPPRHEKALADRRSDDNNTNKNKAGSHWGHVPGSKTHKTYSRRGTPPQKPLKHDSIDLQTEIVLVVISMRTTRTCP